jgi:hypothetical protein
LFALFFHSHFATWTPVAGFIVVHPGVQVKPIKSNAALPYGNFDDPWADFRIKAVSVHPAVGRRVPVANYSVLHSAHAFLSIPARQFHITARAHMNHVTVFGCAVAVRAVNVVKQQHRAAWQAYFCISRYFV